MRFVNAVDIKCNLLPYVIADVLTVELNMTARIRVQHGKYKNILEAEVLYNALTIPLHAH